MLLLLLLIIPIIGIFIIKLNIYIRKYKIIRNYNFIIGNIIISSFPGIRYITFLCFFESILPPLFILIGLFGSSNRVRASFYLFLYTLLGSLFLLLSILTISSIMGTTDFDALYKTNFNYYTQLSLFYGIFIAFAVKTPTISLNT